MGWEEPCTLLFAGRLMWLMVTFHRLAKGPLREGPVTTSPRSRSMRNVADAKLVKDLAKRRRSSRGSFYDRTLSALQTGVAISYATHISPRSPAQLPARPAALPGSRSPYPPACRNIGPPRRSPYRTGSDGAALYPGAGPDRSLSASPS